MIIMYFYLLIRFMMHFNYISIKVVSWARRCSSHVILWQQPLFYSKTTLTFSNSVMCFYNGSHCLFLQAPQLPRDYLHRKITLGAPCLLPNWLKKKKKKVFKKGTFFQIQIFFFFFFLIQEQRATQPLL